MSSIPFLFHWTQQERWSVLLSLGGFSSWAYPLVCLSILCLGGLCGMLMVRSKLLGTLALRCWRSLLLSPPPFFCLSPLTYLIPTQAGEPSP